MLLNYAYAACASVIYFVAYFCAQLQLKCSRLVFHTIDKAHKLLAVKECQTTEHTHTRTHICERDSAVCWGKKTIFVIEMQLKFVSIVGSNVRWLHSHTHTHTYLLQTLTPPPSPLLYFGPVSMSWQIFNELHYLRVLSSGWGLPACSAAAAVKKKSLFSIMPWPGKTENMLEKQKAKKAEKQKRNGQTNANSNMAAGGGGFELFKTCAMIDYAQTDV